MIDPGIPPLIDDLAVRLEKAYGVPPSKLHLQLEKIGRDMPGKFHREAKVLAQAEQAMGQPIVARQIDLEAVQMAHANLLPHLKGQNLDDRRKHKLYKFVGSVLFNLLILAIVIVVVLALVDRI